MTGASGHPAEAHNGSFFSHAYKYFLHSCVEVLLIIPTAEKHLCECQEEQGPSEVIEIWKWMEGQMLTGRWRRVRSVHLIKVKSSGTTER